MIQYISLIISFLIFYIFCFYGKKHLYANEHDESIRNELNQFEETLDKIDKIEKQSEFKQSGHLYV